MDYPEYEQKKRQDGNFPVILDEHSSDSSCRGCYFHWHELLEFYVVKAGGVRLLCSGREEWVYPGEIGFVNWCEPHRGMRFLDGTQHDIVQIDLSALFGQTQAEEETLFLQSILRGAFPLVLRGKNELVHLFEQMAQENRTRTPGWQAALRGLSLLVLTALRRMAEEQPAENQRRGLPRDLELMKQLLVELHQNFEQELSLARLATSLGVCESHLCRTFKRHTGTTVLSYVHQLRCNLAASHLRSGLSVTETARQVGYADYNYFSRMFKRMMGISPKRYQQETEE